MTGNSIFATIQSFEGIALFENLSFLYRSDKDLPDIFLIIIYLQQSSHSCINLWANLIFLSTAWQQKIAMVKPAIRKEVWKVQVFGHVKSII